MKKYVIFGWAAGIAGGQLYTEAKCRVLQNNGYNVYIIYGINDKIVLPSISSAKTIYVPEISAMPSDYFTSSRKKIVNNIVTFIDKQKSDFVFIESNDVRYSYWAELVASEIKCKHFAYCLEGYFDYSSHKNIDYLKFKLSRSEIAGTRKSSLYNLMGSDLITDKNNRFFNAYMGPTYADIPVNSPINWNSYDYVIGYIGRESKPCFEAITKGVSLFCGNHPDLNFLFLCIGCSTEGSIYGETQNLFSQLDNATVYFTGRLFPIPLEYINNLDVSTGSSGSAGIAARNNIKTIKFIDNETKPLGVIGYDIKDFSETRMYEGSLCELLEDVLFNSYCERFCFTNIFDDMDTEAVEKNLLKDSIEMMSPCDLIYYNTAKIKRTGLKGLILSILHRVNNRFKIKSSL